MVKKIFLIGLVEEFSPFCPELLTVEDEMLILAILVFTSTLAPSMAQNNVSALQALVINSVII